MLFLASSVLPLATLSGEDKRRQEYCIVAHRCRALMNVHTITHSPQLPPVTCIVLLDFLVSLPRVNETKNFTEKQFSHINTFTTPENQTTSTFNYFINRPSYQVRTRLFNSTPADTRQFYSSREDVSDGKRFNLSGGVLHHHISNSIKQT